MFDDTYLTLAYPHVSADSCNIQYPETVRNPGNTAGHAVSLASIPFKPSSLGVIVAWMLIFFFPRYPRPAVEIQFAKAIPVIA